MKVDALGSERHFADHLRPVLNALPPEVRGGLFTRAHTLSKRAGPVLVAAYGDLKRARAQTGRPIIMLEHGAGQTYRDAGGKLLQHTSYAGGRDRAGVILYLVPGPSAARAYLEAGVTVPVLQVGCAKLDPWLSGEKTPALDPVPTIGVSFHWDCDVVLETRTTWPRYLPAFIRAHQSGKVRILGHAHPRIAEVVRSMWVAAGIEWIHDFSTILNRAHAYACDNSSTMYEFAATRRPVIVLNHRFYRRSVHHGLRFWEAAGLGPIVDHEDEIPDAIHRALHPSDRMMRQAWAAVQHAYAVTDGTSAARAAHAILQHALP